MAIISPKIGRTPRIFLGAGHGGADPGACANGLKEKDLTLITAMVCKTELQRSGCIVGISRTRDENDGTAQSIPEAKAFEPDFAMDCHFNAGGGKGFEIYRQTNTYGVKGLEVAKCIEKAVIAMGQNSRGIKTHVQANGTDYFGFLRQNPFPALLAEGAFVDNAGDVALINTPEKVAKFGIAYAKGILDYFGMKWVPEKTSDISTVKKTMYCVMKQTVALSSFEAANTYVKQMREEEPGVYWFVMEKEF